MISMQTVESKDQEDTVILENVEVDTFIRFSEFAYKGDYTPVDPEDLHDLPAANAGTPTTCDSTQPVKVENSHGSTDEVQLSAPASGKRKRRDSRERLRNTEDASPYLYNLKQTPWRSFKELKFFESGPYYKHHDIWKGEDYTGVFLCHAYVYVFALKYEIESLQMLSLHKLHQSLRACRHFKTHDTVPVMEYAYLNTRDTDDNESRIDPLRSLVIHYAACFIENLVKSPRFLTLLKNGGEFSRDLIRDHLSGLD